MERRDETLREALVKNEEERKRWELYLQENETAIKNLDMFSKKLTVDVMVPIGSRALIPGEICHTNEVFVSHFQGMFSKCSVFQAQKICKERIKMAKERLEKLEKEQELFENKLYFPRTGALPAEGEKEIIEEYDEEKERLWMEEHKQRVREHKRKERQELVKSSEQGRDDVMKMLDELELMEELDQELEQLQVEDDDTLQKLMSGEIKLPQEKRRISHYSTQSDVVIGNEVENKTDIVKKKKSVVEEISAKYKGKQQKGVETTDFTNNNSIPNSQDFQYPESDSDDEEVDVPAEVSQVEKETENLNPKTRLRIFKKKLKETEKSLQNLKIANMDDLDRKAHLLEVREYFADYVEILKDEVEMNESPEEEENKGESNAKNEKTKKKKSIRFALEDQVKLIESNYENTDQNYKERDVITLDPSIDPKVAINTRTVEIPDTSLREVPSKKLAILERVEKTCQFISEYQSQQDFNLVDKILSAEENNRKTLLIKFNHSDKLFQYPGYETESLSTENSSGEVIGSPADIYKVFSSYLKNDETNTIEEILPRETRSKQDSDEAAYEDPKIKFLSHKTDDENKENEEELNSQKSVSEIKKSILKNKDAVKQETHLKEVKPRKNRKKKSPVDEYGGFDAIMGEVVENPITEPDPLPKEKFVDAHAPKKGLVDSSKCGPYQHSSYLLCNK